MPATNQRKTALFLVFVVVSNSLGNLSLSLGMKDSRAGLIASLLNPWVLLGIAFLIFWTLTRMALLSWADLSYVLPVSAIGYVLNALLGRFFLSEHLTWERWAGTLLIVAGTALAGATGPSSKRS